MNDHEAMRIAVAPYKDDRTLVGWFWTDTLTWDLHRTRALRGTDWVSELRLLPKESSGRQAYMKFLDDRYRSRLKDFNLCYGLAIESLDDLGEVDFRTIAVGRHVVHEDDMAFLEVIAQRFYEIVGKAPREADPNHLVLGDRYLAGDSRESVLIAAKPWIDAVAVQPGDRYTMLYPPSTEIPSDEIEAPHVTTGKPVLICDHAINFPTESHPRTIFEQMLDEGSAAAATSKFLKAAFAKKYLLGYFRCQYIDRPASFGRGLRQGILNEKGFAREPIVSVYRDAFEEAIEVINTLNPE
jgi:hypothetical protein